MNTKMNHDEMRSIEGDEDVKDAIKACILVNIVLIALMGSSLFMALNWGGLWSLPLVSFLILCVIGFIWTEIDDRKIMKDLDDIYHWHLDNGLNFHYQIWDRERIKTWKNANT